MTKNDLREILDELDIEWKSRMNKAELFELVAGAGVDLNDKVEEEKEANWLYVQNKVFAAELIRRMKVFEERGSREVNPSVISRGHYRGREVKNIE